MFEQRLSGLRTMRKRLKTLHDQICQGSGIASSPAFRNLSMPTTTPPIHLLPDDCAQSGVQSSPVPITASEYKVASNISNIDHLDLQRRLAEMQDKMYRESLYGGVVGQAQQLPPGIYGQSAHTTTDPRAPSMDEAKALGCYWRLVSELPELHKDMTWHTHPNHERAPLRVEIQHRPDINETYVLVRVPPKSNEGEFYLAEPYRGFPSEELITKLRLIR